MARVKVPIAVIDPSGNAVAGAAVQVKKRSDGTNATLYQAETGPTTLSNPTTTDSYGRVQAWVDRGAYNADISGTGITTYTQPFEASAASDRSIDEPWLPVGAQQTTVANPSPLPTSPVDGQKIDYYLQDGIVWQFKYVSATSGSNKWLFMGGNPLPTVGGQVGGIALSSFTHTDASGLCSLTVPLSGLYMVSAQLDAYQTAGTAGQEIQVVTGVDASTWVVTNVGFVTNLNQSIGLSGERRLTLTAGQTVKIRLASGAGTWTVRNQGLFIRPAQVS